MYNTQISQHIHKQSQHMNNRLHLTYPAQPTSQATFEHLIRNTTPNPNRTLNTLHKHNNVHTHDPTGSSTSPNPQHILITRSTITDAATLSTPPSTPHSQDAHQHAPCATDEALAPTLVPTFTKRGNRTRGKDPHNQPLTPTNITDNVTHDSNPIPLYRHP